MAYRQKLCIFIDKKKILNNVMEWQQWSSIAPLLPTFAEAAPEAVLEKLKMK